MRIKCRFCDKEIIMPDDFSGDAFRIYILPENNQEFGMVDVTVYGCKDCAEFFDQAYYDLKV